MSDLFELAFGITMVVLVLLMVATVYALPVLIGIALARMVGLL